MQDCGSKTSCFPVLRAGELRTAVRLEAPYTPRFDAPELPPVYTAPAGLRNPALELGKHNSLLLLILAFAVGIADLAGFIGAEKQNLAQPFVGVNLGR